MLKRGLEHELFVGDLASNLRKPHGGAVELEKTAAEQWTAEATHPFHRFSPRDLQPRQRRTSLIAPGESSSAMTLQRAGFQL